MKRSKVALVAVVLSVGLLLLGVFTYMNMITPEGKKAILSTPNYTEEMYDNAKFYMQIGIPVQVIIIIIGYMAYLKNNIILSIVALVLSIGTFIVFSILVIPQIVLFAVAITKVKQCKLDEEMKNYEDDGVIL